MATTTAIQNLAHLHRPLIQRNCLNQIHSFWSTFSLLAGALPFCLSRRECCTAISHANRRIRTIGPITRKTILNVRRADSGNNINAAPKTARSSSQYAIHCTVRQAHDQSKQARHCFRHASSDLRVKRVPILSRPPSSPTEISLGPLYTE